MLASESDLVLLGAIQLLGWAQNPPCAAGFLFYFIYCIYVLLTFTLFGPFLVPFVVSSQPASEQVGCWKFLAYFCKQKTLLGLTKSLCLSICALKSHNECLSCKTDPINCLLPPFLYWLQGEGKKSSPGARLSIHLSIHFPNLF